MNILKQVLKFGIIVFFIGGSFECEPGAKFEWVPYALMIMGLAMTVGYLVIETQFYTGD